MMRITIVVPAYNEEESIEDLVAAIAACDPGPGREISEVIFVDDGSSDATWKRICSASSESATATVRGYRFRSNFGKAAALDLGFRKARGDIIVTMDADLQDDPAEIRSMIDRISEGFDVVSGWKKQRHDPLEKTLPSRIFNGTVCRITGIKLHDFNCGLKAYRAEVVQQIQLYGELHRFIPVLAAARGFRVTEQVVAHHPRKFGSSKYGWRRYVRGFIDLLTVVAITRYLARPAHLFGGIGVLMGGIGMAVLVYLTGLWVLGDRPIGNRPLLLFGVLCVVVATQFLSFGLLAELFTRQIGHEKNEDAGIAEVLGGDRTVP